MFDGLDAIRAACASLPAGNPDAEAAAAARQAQLIKPPGSLGRLESLVPWLARWQGRETPSLACVEVAVFAGNHGVAAHNVSIAPPSVTAQMVDSFRTGRAAINQIAAIAGAGLRIVPLLHAPTADITEAQAMDPAAFLAAVNAGAAVVRPRLDLLCLGEMGIGNTTAAAALCAGLFGGGGALWAGRGTGIDDATLARKAALVDRAIARHHGDPLYLAQSLGGHELAILGATLAARLQGVPVLLDGFVCTAAAAPLALLAPGALDHTRLAHLSAESGHSLLAEHLRLSPLLSLGMRLGEGSGAALAVPLLRAALACHTGMATFAEAGITVAP